MYDFGLRLKTIRVMRKLTQKDLATRINKSSSAISSYELNTQLPPLDVCVSIASTLGVSLDYLVGMENIPTYSVSGLSPDKAELIQLIMNELLSPSSTNDTLSEQQIMILQKLFKAFLSKNE